MIIWIWFHTTIWHNLVSAPFISSKINPPYCIIVVNIVHIPISNVRFLTMILQITPPYCIIVVNIIVHIPISNVRFLTMILKKARSSFSSLETIYLFFTKTPYNRYIQHCCQVLGTLFCHFITKIPIFGATIPLSIFGSKLSSKTRFLLLRNDFKKCP